MPKTAKASYRRDSYLRCTHRPLTCLAFLAPLLVLFQVGAFYYRSHLLAPKHLARALEYFGATAVYLPALLVAAVLLLQHLLRRERWQVRPKVLAGMLAEAILWAIPLIAFNYVAALPHNAHLARAPGELSSLSHYLTNLSPELQTVYWAVAAGIYEEFIFRLVLISVVMLIFVDVFGLRRDAVAIAAVIAAAALFSLYHFLEQITGQGPFPWGIFLFRMTAGVYLGTLFVFRGFAIAVGTHIAYNVYVYLYLTA